MLWIFATVFYTQHIAMVAVPHTVCVLLLSSPSIRPDGFPRAVQCLHYPRTLKHAHSRYAHISRRTRTSLSCSLTVERLTDSSICPCFCLCLPTADTLPTPAPAPTPTASCRTFVCLDQTRHCGPACPCSLKTCPYQAIYSYTLLKQSLFGYLGVVILPLPRSHTMSRDEYSNDFSPSVEPPGLSLVPCPRRAPHRPGGESGGIETQ